MKLYFPNLSFEDELADSSYRPNAATIRAANELAPLMLWASEETDLCLLNARPEGIKRSSRVITWKELPETTDLPLRTLVPWGWTERSCQVARDAQINFDCVPQLDAVKAVNSRNFLQPFDVICDTGGKKTSQFSFACKSKPEAMKAVERLMQNGWNKWVMKPELSHAGRNRLIGSQTTFHQQQSGWMKRQWETGGTVFVEPWVEIQEEGSLHFEIPQRSQPDEIRMLGHTRLLNDSAGRYLGSEVSFEESDADSLQTLRDKGFQICTAVRQAGYFGPVGLDYFSYLDQRGQLQWRVCNDLNARWTMGRVALKIAKQMTSRGFFRWEHFVSGTSANLDAAVEKALTKLGHPDVDILRTSPDYVGGEPVRLGSVAFRADSADILRDVGSWVRRYLT